MTAQLREIKSTKTVWHLPYWKPDTREISVNSWFIQLRFYLLLLTSPLCHNFFETRRLSRLMRAYHCHERRITNTSELASSLVIAPSFSSVDIYNFQVPMWTQQRLQFSRCTGVSSLQRSGQPIEHIDLWWVNWKDVMRITTRRFYSTH